MQQKKYPVKRGEELNVSIENVAFGGKGICRVDDYVIFVPNTIPGDEAKIKITKRKTGFGEGRLLEILKPSSFRQDAPCKYFDWCGGCTWQSVSYEKQLEFKWNHVKESIQHLAGIENIEVPKPIASGKIFAYRNKMEFSFADKRWLLPHELGNMEIGKSFALGLHVPGTFDKIISIDECMLQSDTANQILSFISNYCKENNIEPYGIRSHEGYLRFLVIRESSASGNIMVNIVTADKNSKELEKLAKELSTKFPQIKSIINTINDRKAQIAFGEKEVVLFGDSFITDKLFNNKYKISANSFFQTNTKQAKKLYEIVLQYAAITDRDTVWDLYCGTGTITLLLADKAKHVYGFELIERAVLDAKKNAKEFGIQNVEFVLGNVLVEKSNVKDNPDVIVIDPPRSGLHPKVAEYLNKSHAKKIVYVSCNPTTMARDIKIIKENYKLTKIQPVDMFPQTYHIETVALLERKNA
jgi:23S rRNA (uracil1939-C5)-methyltransferase